MKTAIIVNPASGGGKNFLHWKKIRSDIHSVLGETKELITQAPHDATRYAEFVAKSGEFDTLIIVGGDGTINETINGLFYDKGKAFNPDLKVGIISTGSGCDFIRSVGIPRNPEDALSAFKNYAVKKCDVGFAVFKNEHDQKQYRYFINIAAAGLAGVVASKVNKSLPFISPQLVYLIATARYFLTFKRKKITLILDSEVKYEGSCINLFIANLTYSAAGMCWAPEAKMDNGLFNVVIVESLPKWRLFTSTWKLYDGSFCQLPGVHLFKAREIIIKSQDNVLLELDGEQCGVAPLTCQIVPQALNLITPA